MENVEIAEARGNMDRSFAERSGKSRTCCPRLQAGGERRKGQMTGKDFLREEGGERERPRALQHGGG